MQKFTNPLDNIKIASPCSADWNEMIGNERKRFCGDCKLNVYNLSGMSKDEAESLLMNSEGRLCVRFFRRPDGSVLTQDCPVGWARIKRKVSRAATAAFSLLAGVFGGLFAFAFFKVEEKPHLMGTIAVSNSNTARMGDVAFEPTPLPMMGNVAPINQEPDDAIMGKMAIPPDHKRR